MISLKDFSEKDFSRLINWIATERELVQFSGPIFTFPLTEIQLKKYIENDKLKPKIIVDIESGEVIGHCELNFLHKIPRLSRILIGSKNHRGKGYGKLLVDVMIEEIKKIQPTNKVELRVFEWNKNAVELYKKKGFKIEPEHCFDFKYKEDEFWKNLYMSKELN